MQIKIFLSLLFLFTFCFSSQSETQPDLHFLTRKPMPNFVLDTLEKKDVHLSQFRGNSSIIIYFWATWCPGCKEKLAYFAKSQDEFAANNVKIAAVNSGESKEEILKFLDKYQINIDTFLDLESSLDKPFGVTQLPTIIFVNPDGIVMNVTHHLPTE